jgi:hypothetical protein
MDYLSRLSGISWFSILFSAAGRNQDGTILRDLRVGTSDTTSMTRWSFPLRWKLDARRSIPKIFTTARQLMDN